MRLRRAKIKEFYRVASCLVGCSLLSVLLSCQGGSQISSPTSGAPIKSKPPKASSDANPAAVENQVSMEEPVNYPSYTFKGIGNMTHDSDTFTSTSAIETTISETELTLNQTARTVDLRGKGGSDKQRDADDKIRRQSVGATKYKRSTIEERKTLGEDNVPYAIFASGVSTFTGRTYTFSAPVPVFPIPGNEGRFAGLTGTKNFKAEVKCTGCPMVSSFAINVSITKVSSVAGMVSLKLDTSIEGQGISGGIAAAYHGFPLAKSATFVIDTNTSMVTSLDTLHLFLQSENASGAGSGPEERSTMQYKICTFKKGSDDQSFPCQ